MKIQLKEKELVRLYDMKIGQTFFYNNNFYMKIDEEDSFILAAVNLHTGKISGFELDKKVQKINLTLVEI